MNRLTIILSCQRSGTTFLERCLAGTGLAGNFDEHFVNFIDLNQRVSPELRGSPHLFLKALQAARDRSGNYGITLMSDYLPVCASRFFGKALPMDRNEQVALSVEFLNELNTFFEEVSYIVLTRNVVQRAISLLLLQATRRGHIINDVERNAPGDLRDHKAVLPEISAQQIVSLSQTSLLQIDFLHQVLAQLDAKVVETTYDEITSSPQRVADILTNLGFAGAETKKIIPKTKKVVASEDAMELATRAANYLGLEDWTYQSLEDTMKAPAFAELEKERRRVDRNDTTDVEKNSPRSKWQRVKRAFKSH
ncbi:Stf0 sulfotransferase [Shimia isoporae]|uniref:Stf0 sulfotransferase n=1 Tax=Shimia isoporae TaxID=647720 RepID=A0A4R1N774_9RHOB|nr:Stf0 family sulfotransferase [Shimia isoporae]TCK98899.1 Stf0 sulfotransferase [Shimia isoporae]